MARKFQFDEFTLDESRYSLQRGDRVLRLEKRPMELLLLLVERQGDLVSRDEIAEKLWGKDVFVDVDHSINTAVRKVRQVLRDDPDKPRYVETVVGKGYRFAAPLICRNDVSSSLAEVENTIPTTQAASESMTQTSAPTVAVAFKTPLEVPRARRKVVISKWLWVALGAIAAAFIVALITGSVPSPTTPVVKEITQLTDDGLLKIGLFTDGERIYFNQGEYTGFTIAEVAIGGGPVSVIPTTLKSPKLVGVAPKGSSLLMLSMSDPFGPLTLWQLPLPAGSLRQLSNIHTNSANYTPGGRILYTDNDSLWIADSDGSNSRKLVTGMPGLVNDPSMSPDGSHIAFTVNATGSGQTPAGITLPAIFETNADGSGVHEIMHGKAGEWVCCASWTADSRYILVTKVHHRSANIWLVPQKSGWLSGKRLPIQVTNGPIAYGGAMATPDGKQILSIGIKLRGEVVRYDLREKQFLPFLSGISAFDPSFSSDGEWVAYMSYPDDTLWRSRSDGSERLQLTYPPDEVYYPFLSPDGKQVVYQTTNSDGAYVISIDGGAPKKVIDFNCSPPNWSPDSKKLIFNDYRRGYEHAAVNVLDLATGQITLLPGNQLGPQWIGPDKLIGGRSDLKGFQVFDFATQQWTDVPNPEQARVILWAHSPDFKYFFYATGDTVPKVIRLRIADWQAEVVTTLKDFPLARGPDWNATITVAPDGSPIFTRELGTQEIYAMTVKWP
jgi:DNA-binding winged helix-turn-helix (wHTH) protein/Tol biopolymer transport system component